MMKSPIRSGHSPHQKRCALMVLSLTLAASALSASPPPSSVLTGSSASTLHIMEPATNDSDKGQDLQDWLQAYDCAVRILPSSGPRPATPGASSELFFATYSAAAPPQGLTLLVPVLTRGETPLGVAWLIKASTGITDPKSIEKERIAIGPEHAFLSRTEPLRLLEEADVDLNTLTQYVSQEYQGMMVLLLHGDVFAAAVPTPLALPWASANDLHVLLKTSDAYLSGIWGVPAAEHAPCVQALSRLKKEGRKDPRFALFPEWVTGFHSP